MSRARLAQARFDNVRVVRDGHGNRRCSAGPLAPPRPPARDFARGSSDRCTGSLDPFLDAHRGYDPRTGEFVPLPSTTPAECGEGWTFLGYDVSDGSGLSGLSNCGYRSEELESLRAHWGSRLNDRHLFATFADADAFRLLSDARVPEHAPFAVYGLWRVS